MAEVWLRGPLPGIPPLLQPVAHALLQAQEEIHQLMEGFPDAKLWERPANAASPGFHLQHIAGVLDRLLTYAAAQPLSGKQLEYLAAEGSPAEGVQTAALLKSLNAQIAAFLEQLRSVDPATLTDERTVGRKRLPSTVMGLLFHAAEHTMRHTGQLLVTVKVLSSLPAVGPE